MMKNNSLYRAALLLALLYLAPAAWPQGFQITPLPLAKDARAKPDEFPEQKARRELNANYARMNVLIGSRDYDALEKLAQDWLAQYAARKIDEGQYLDLLNTLAPGKAGKGLVADMQAWTQARPRSYAAWYSLGSLYYDIAWQERGERTASETTRQQFEAMGRYAQLSQEAYLKSASLTATPVASHDRLIRVAAILARSRGDATAVSRNKPAPQRQRFCPAKLPADGLFPGTLDEQLYHLCLVLRSDPDAVETFNGFAYLNSPRWGGNYARLQKLLEEIAGDKRTSPQALGRMWAGVVALQAWDQADANQPHIAAELYAQAFRAAPLPQHVKWLYTAAEYERDKVKNPDRAQALFTEITAYRSGEYEAVAALGWIHEERGDLKNYMENMAAAAMLGKKEAQNNLGYYYMVGQRGLPRDLQQARQWLTLAANQGFEHAREKLGVVDAMIAKEKGK